MKATELVTELRAAFPAIPWVTVRSVYPETSNVDGVFATLDAIEFGIEYSAYRNRYTCRIWRNREMIRLGIENEDAAAAVRNAARGYMCGPDATLLALTGQRAVTSVSGSPYWEAVPA